MTAAPAPSRLDCLIVGGGPAGLTAAIYAARFQLSLLVLDGGKGRAQAIPCTRNHAGFPDGISGADLIARMRTQAVKSGARLEFGQVSELHAVAHGFQARWEGGSVQATAVLLATGVMNHGPKMPENLRHSAMTAGRLRYCPVCDGREVLDQNIAVIGSGEHGVREALFLRAYSRRITLVAPHGEHDLTAAQRRILSSAAVMVVDGPATDFELSAQGLGFVSSHGRQSFEAVYPAMGSTVHSDLARQVGAATGAEGCIKVDPHQRTSVPGLYAAGDVVVGLDQISHAMGEAGVAATTIRNDLASSRPQFR